jgi:hypothetical protein
MGEFRGASECSDCHPGVALSGSLSQAFQGTASLPVSQAWCQLEWCNKKISSVTVDLSYAQTEMMQTTSIDSDSLALASLSRSARFGRDSDGASRSGPGSARRDGRRNGGALPQALSPGVQGRVRRRRPWALCSGSDGVGCGGGSMRVGRGGRGEGLGGCCWRLGS